MIFKRQKDKALFLSIETVGVIIIITAISAVVVAGIAHLFKMYKVHQISRDVSQLSEAVVNFKITYRSLPGDLPASKLSANLNNSYLVTDVTTKVSPTCGTAYSCSLGKITNSSGSLISFRELSLAKLISMPINTTTAITATITSGLADLITLISTDKVLPIASWDDSLAWMLGSDSDDVAFATNSPAKSVIYNTDISAAWPSTRPRLILFRYGSLTTTTKILDLSDPSLKLGAISPNIAAEVAGKLGDGSASSESTRVISENAGVVSTCTSVSVVNGTSAATGDVSSATFQNSNDDSGSKGCVMLFGIDGTEA